MVDIDLLRAGHAGVLSCDGRRSVEVPAGGRVRVRRGAQPVRIARIGHWSFADRLVAKFQLPVRGFRDEHDVACRWTRANSATSSRRARPQLSRLRPSGRG